MHPYSYVITLRIRHPSMEPQEITAALERQPERAWEAGSPRQTPAGTPLEGIYRESYWYTKLVQERSSEGTLLEESLAEIGKNLDGSRSFFDRIRAEGGRAELFIGVYGGRNFGLEFAPSLLLNIAQIGLSLSFDVYPEA